MAAPRILKGREQAPRPMAQSERGLCAAIPSSPCADFGYTPTPLPDRDHNGSAAFLKADPANEEDGSGLTSWKLQVPSHFLQRRSRPYPNNDVVLQPNACAFNRGFMPSYSGSTGFKVRRDDEPLEVEEDRRALQLALHGSGTTRMGVTNTNTPRRRKSERARYRG